MIDIIKQVIVVRRDLITREENPMTSGKLAAQVAHASMAPILELARGRPYAELTPLDKEGTLTIDLEKHSSLKEWLAKDFTKIVLYVKSEESLIKVFNTIREAGYIASLIKDNGRTIFSEPTITCFGVEPLPASIIGPLTKKLRLLK